MKLLTLFLPALLLVSTCWAASPAKRITPTRSSATRVTRSLKAVPARKAAPARPLRSYQAQRTRSSAVRRMPAYRFSARHRSAMRITNFRPVLAARQLEDMPEMAMPVAGLTARELQDSFFYRRPDGMIHYAIDIFRPIGDELYSVVDGTIERLDPNPLGGVVVYVVDTERRFRFYYAHLSRHADGLYAGMEVKRGDLLGYVGDTGNAKGTQPHLHFQIANLAGAVVNPYPLLMELVRRDDTQLAE